MFPGALRGEFSPTGSWISNRVRRCVAEFDRRTISGTRVERYNLLAPVTSLRLRSRIVPRTPSSLGKKLAICACGGLSFSAIGVYPRFLPDLSAYLSTPRCKNPSRCFHVLNRLCGGRIAPRAADTADGRTNSSSRSECRPTTQTCLTMNRHTLSRPTMSLLRPCSLYASLIRYRTGTRCNPV